MAGKLRMGGRAVYRFFKTHHPSAGRVAAVYDEEKQHSDAKLAIYFQLKKCVGLIYVEWLHLEAYNGEKFAQ